jgi:hypothetical protein
MTDRRFPPPWTVEKIPGGLKVCDANGQSLAYVYSRENPNDAHMAKLLTEDEARSIASNIAKDGSYKNSPIANTKTHRAVRSGMFFKLGRQ